MQKHRAAPLRLSVHDNMACTNNAVEFSCGFVWMHLGCASQPLHISGASLACYGHGGWVHQNRSRLNHPSPKKKANIANDVHIKTCICRCDISVCLRHSGQPWLTRWTLLVQDAQKHWWLHGTRASPAVGHVSQSDWHHNCQHGHHVARLVAVSGVLEVQHHHPSQCLNS